MGNDIQTFAITVSLGKVYVEPIESQNYNYPSTYVADIIIQESRNGNGSGIVKVYAEKTLANIKINDWLISPLFDMSFNWVSCDFYIMVQDKNGEKTTIFVFSRSQFCHGIENAFREIFFKLGKYNSVKQLLFFKDLDKLCLEKKHESLKDEADWVDNLSKMISRYKQIRETLSVEVQQSTETFIVKEFSTYISK